MGDRGFADGPGHVVVLAAMGVTKTGRYNDCLEENSGCLWRLRVCSWKAD